MGITLDESCIDYPNSIIVNFLDINGISPTHIYNLNAVCNMNIYVVMHPNGCFCVGGYDENRFVKVQLTTNLNIPSQIITYVPYVPEE